MDIFKKATAAATAIAFGVAIMQAAPNNAVTGHEVTSKVAGTSSGAAHDENPEAIPFFTSLDVDQGLSQSTVLSCCQDSSGQMWFATLDGLNRYDGYDFTIYRHSDTDSTSILSNMIRKVFTDTGGNLWAGTDKGLTFHDRKSDSFRNFPTGDRAVTGIADISSHEILVVTGGELRTFDTEKMEWAGENILKQAGNIKATVLYDDGDSVRIGTEENGVLLWNKSSRNLTMASSGDITRAVQCIIRHGDRIYVATEGDGLYFYDLTTGQSGSFKHESGNPRSISSNYVRTLATDNFGRLWAGTYGGLSIMDGNGFINIDGDMSKEGALSQNSVRCIRRDSQGGMWLGTYFGGINYWHPLMNRFRTLHHNPSSNSLNDNIIGCIAEDSDGTLWIGTNSGGVNHYNPRNGSFKVFRLKNEGKQMPESDDIKAILVDRDIIYIGAHAGGLSAINRKTGNSKHFTGDNKDGRMDIYAILPDGEDKLWIGSLSGLRIFDKRAGTFSSPDLLDCNIEIRALMLDSNGVLWVGGDSGFSTLRQNGSSLRKYDCGIEEDILGESFVQCFFESTTSLIWIGTRNGLLCHDKTQQRTTRYTCKDGLPSEIIHGIEEDRAGRLWISTDKGLSCFNPLTGVFRNFTAGDGLQSNRFNTGCHLKLKSGDMMFGGIGGITYFNPDAMKDNPFAPKPVITCFKTGGEKTNESDRNFTKNINSTGQITLKHWQNSFSVVFSVPNYLAGRHNKFSYTLEGYDKQWKETDSEREISWSNLPHGKYKFMVKAANNDGIWNQEPAVLKIRICPAWYESLAAKIGYAILLLCLAFLIYQYIVRKTGESKRRELQKQEEAHRDEMEQMKMRFYINISHEMRTPLTLIVNPLSEMIARCTDTWMRKELKYVERNTSRLLHLVNQLMDYRRAELDVFKLKVHQEDILKTIRENFSLYEKLAAKKKIKYNLITNLEGRTALVDAQYIELILNNLLSNAFKYTDSGSITVSALLTKGSLVLEISDTGTGIPEGQKENIFERFYQNDKNHIGSGIGLSLVQRLVSLHHGTIDIKSEVGKGSSFIVTLPQSEEDYSPDETSAGNTPDEIHTINPKEMFLVDTEEDEEEAIVEVGGTKRGKILIAEDNEEMSGYMKNGLSETFDVILAVNGAEALEKIRQFSPDIVITDMVMPVMDGIKLCASIKHDSHTSDLPVLVISSKTEKKDQMEALENGADDYIVKPFSMAALNAKIRNMLRTRAMMLDKVTKSMDIVPERISFNAMDEQILGKAIETVKANMDNADFSTEDFARLMNMSRSNLHIKLKALTGESALEFIRKVRFKEACRLLEDGRYSISEISDKVGFNTASYFSTSFKKYMGCLPTEWIRNRQKR